MILLHFFFFSLIRRGNPNAGVSRGGSVSQPVEQSNPSNQFLLDLNSLILFIQGSHPHPPALERQNSGGGVLTQPPAAPNTSGPANPQNPQSNFNLFLKSQKNFFFFKTLSFKGSNAPNSTVVTAPTPSAPPSSSSVQVD